MRVAPVVAAIAALSLSACASKEPMVMTPTFQRTETPAWAAASPASNAPCRVWIAEVRDRTEGQGEIGGRVVEAGELSSWARHALESLGQDPRLSLVSAEDPSVVSIRASLLKAYLRSVTTSKSVNVALRVTYQQGAGPSEDQLYRGVDDTVNWDATEAESRNALNRALAKVVDDVHAEVLRRCGGNAAVP